MVVNLTARAGMQSRRDNLHFLEQDIARLSFPNKFVLELECLGSGFSRFRDHDGCRKEAVDGASQRENLLLL